MKTNKTHKNPTQACSVAALKETWFSSGHVQYYYTAYMYKPVPKETRERKENVPRKTREIISYFYCDCQEWKEFSVEGELGYTGDREESINKCI